MEVYGFKEQNNFVDKLLYVDNVLKTIPYNNIHIQLEKNNCVKDKNNNFNCNELHDFLTCLFSRFSKSTALLKRIKNNYQCCSLFLLVDFISKIQLLLDGKSYNQINFKKENLPFVFQTICSPFISTKFSKEYAILKFLFNYYSGTCELAYITPDQPVTCYQSSIYEMCILFNNAIETKMPKTFEIYKKLKNNEEINNKEIDIMLQEYEKTNCNE